MRLWNNLKFPPNILSLKSNKSNFSTIVRTPLPGWAPGGLVSLFAEPPFFSSPFHSHGKKIDDDHDDDIDIYIMMNCVSVTKNHHSPQSEPPARPCRP